ncbi:unnamed protein product [Discosporangium mesarthrocarpum]
MIPTTYLTTRTPMPWRSFSCFALLVGKRLAAAFPVARIGAQASQHKFALPWAGRSMATSRQPLHSLYWSHHSGSLGLSHGYRQPSMERPGRLFMSSLPGGADSEICRAAHILVSDEKAADAALARIKSGENFGEIAQDLSSCPSKEKGGDLGWFKRGQMVAEFEEACFGNDAGTVVKVRTQFGWHVVALLAKAVLPKQISAQELEDLLIKGVTDGVVTGPYQFVDVREENELGQAKIEGFVNLPLSKFEEWGPKLQGEDPILDKEKTTVVLCHHGMRSQQVAQHLATKSGFKSVLNVDGGIHNYAKEVNPSVGMY